MSLEAVLPPIVRGAEEVYTVSIAVDGVPLPLPGQALRVELWWEGEVQVVLSPGTGIELLDLSPPAPDEGEDPAPQFQFRIDETTSSGLPANRRVEVWVTRVTAEGRTIIRGPFHLPVKR